MRKSKQGMGLCPVILLCLSLQRSRRPICNNMGRRKSNISEKESL